MTADVQIAARAAPAPDLRTARHLTQAALDRHFAAGTARAVTGDERGLWAAVQDAAAGGKGLRPALFLDVYHALGGTDDDVAGRVCAALELLHTALVIHDDVIDRDTVRRGRPNVSGSYAARARERGHTDGQAARFGDTAAILAGDLALTGAVRLVASCGAPLPVVERMLDHLDRTLHVTAAGELADVRLSMDGDAEVGQAVEMERHKTAVYSFELPLLLAAVLTGREEPDAPVLRAYARRLGVVYQLRDDLDGMFGDRAVIGKSTLSDLREGKCTPLVAHARTTAAWSRIQPYLGTAVDDADAAKVRRLLEDSGSRGFVEDLAARLATEAVAAVAHLPIAPVLTGWVLLVTAREA